MQEARVPRIDKHRMKEMYMPFLIYNAQVCQNIALGARNYFESVFENERAYILLVILKGAAPNDATPSVSLLYHLPSSIGTLHLQVISANFIPLQTDGARFMR